MPTPISINPQIQNIFLYALERQGSVEFWHKIGGKSVINENGMHFIKISRKKLNEEIIKIY